MNKNVSIIVIVLIFIGVGWYYYGEATKPAPATGEPIKVGVIAPLTGPAAHLGEWIIQGVSMAEDEINGVDPNNKKAVQLIIEDGQCDGKVAVNAYKKLHDIDKVSYIIGPLCGASSVPVSQIAESDHAILLTTGLVSTNVYNAGDYTFTILPTMAAVAQAIVDFSYSELGYKNISLIYSNDEYGEENKKAVTEKITNLGGKLISAERYDKTKNDFRTQLLKLKADSSSAIVVAGYTPGYISLLKQAKELNVTKQLLAVSNIQDPSLLETALQTKSFVYFSYPSLSRAQSVTQFGEKYKEKYNTDSEFLPMYIGSGYDGLKLLMEVLPKCDRDNVECVRSELLKIKNYQGANGLISFDKNGNNTNLDTIEIRVIKDGKIINLE